MTRLASLLKLLSFCDSGFPTGNFARSNGLEAAHQYAYVVDRESLVKFLKIILEHTASLHLPVVSDIFLCLNIGTASSIKCCLKEDFDPQDAATSVSAARRLLHGTAVSRKHQASRRDVFRSEVLATSLDHIWDINEIVGAALVTNGVEYQTSIDLGNAWLSLFVDTVAPLGPAEDSTVPRYLADILLRLWKSFSDEDGSAYASEMRASCDVASLRHIVKRRMTVPEQPHLTVVCALVFASLGAQCEEACGAFLFNHLRSTVSAAVRTSLIGPIEGQRIMNMFTMTPVSNPQSEHGPEDEARHVNPSSSRSYLETLVHRYAKVDALGRPRPIMCRSVIPDILQAAHPLLFSKLFLT